MALSIIIFRAQLSNLARCQILVSAPYASAQQKKSPHPKVWGLAYLGGGATLFIRLGFTQR
jgi:hypothetical protein